jgi:hypothetical protein
MKGDTPESWFYILIVVMLFFLSIALYFNLIKNAALRNEGVPYSISLYANSLATVESGKVVMEFKKPYDVEVREIGEPERYETLARVLKGKGYGVATKPLSGEKTRFFLIYADTDPVRFSQAYGLDIIKGEEKVYIREGGPR